MLDSRRLTGPNLFWDHPGAILDVALDGIPAERLVSAWSKETGVLMEALGWPSAQTCSRVFDGGVSLVIQAPIDLLYTACELNEAAFMRAVAWLKGEQPPDLHDSIAVLTDLASKEKKPALLAMQAAAARHHVPFLWDDDEVSVGFGKTSITWPADAVPQPESVDWQAVGSVPLGIVTGTNGKSTTVRLSAAILAAAGLRAGITSTDYIRVGEEILDRGDYSGPGGARTLLRHPQCEAVVLEVARGGLLRRGIGVEHADAALITNVAVDHMGEYGINTLAEMTEAKFIVRRALAKDAPLILNLDDAESVRMAATLDNRITWFGLDARHPLLQKHLEKQGQAAYLSDGWLVLADGGETRKIVRVQDVPITFGGAARYNISNALGAMALCHVLGVADEALATGLRTFSGDADANPGRGNLFEKDGIKVFLDFAHNEHGVRAVGDTVRAFDAKRNIVLIGQAGDRTDQDIRNLVNAICDLKPSRLLVCDMPGYERGRQAWVVAEMISEFAIAEGVPKEAVSMFKSPLDGVRQALADAREGDCLVLLAFAQRNEVLAMLREFVAGK
ncbi:MAG TPA: Mur ligase family protein [Xanthomonadales bacterium]